MKKRLPLIVAVMAVMIILFFLFGDYTFQSAPYPLPISPMVAYRITGHEGDMRFFAEDPDSIQGYAIVQREVINDAELQKAVIDTLNSRLIYGTRNYRCFEPGIAIRIGKPGDEIDALICLECRHIYFFRDGKINYRILNSYGVNRIKKLYGRLFPGHAPDGDDNDAKRVSLSRDRERERRQQMQIDLMSKPGAEPSQ